MKRLLFSLSLLLAGLATPALALTVVMQPWSGSDGPYVTVSMDGNTLLQGADDGSGNYSGFMHFRRPTGASFATGTTLYLEVDFKDLGGPGRLGCQYNAVGNAFQAAGMVLGASVRSTGAYKTAVMKLDNADLRLAQNGGNDLRLTRTEDLRFHIKEVRVSDTPGAAYLSETAFLGPYTGPTYAGPAAVDVSTMLGKVVVGYQGWFRTPGDDDDSGWVHWTKSWGSLSPALISEDFWPEMDELGPAERFAAPGFTYPGGAPAHLFSSNNARTVLRHFQWMEAYGIDGAAIQRFTNGLGSPGVDSYRVLTHARAAAHQTGRTWYVEYDMTGTPEGDLVNFIREDWKYLIDVLRIHEDPRYLKHGGLPVAGVYGFFPERFSPATANAIIDIFKTGRVQDRAFVAGAGAWYWRTAAETTPAWQTMLYRLGSWQPWNMGNTLGAQPSPWAKTDYWPADKADFEAHGVIYQPEIYPGGSTANRDGLPPGTDRLARRGGDFLWEQFVAARQLGAQTVFVGMFDELDEGTQLFKVTAQPPVEASFIAYEGQPSDCFLCYTGQGARMVKGEIPLSLSRPDCPARTQPSIPDPLSPLEGATVSGPNVTFSWTTALALAGGGSLTGYEVLLDGVTHTAASLSQALPAAGGAHVWRVRARNSLGNAGGWSVAQRFTVLGPAATPTATRTIGSSPTATPSLTVTPTRSPTRSATPTSSASPTPIPSQVTAGCAAGTSIDGVLDEAYYASGAWMPLSHLTADAYGLGAAAQFQVHQDAGHLLLAVRVLKTGALYSGVPQWQNDSVELYWDASHDRSAAYSSADDFHYTFGWNNAAVDVSAGSDLGGVVFASAAVAGGWALEVSIPFANLKVSSPYPGPVYGFDVAANIASASGTRQCQLTWHASNGNNYLDTSGFGDLSLAGCGTPTPSRTPSATATRSPSATVTPSATPSRSASPSPASSPSQTATVTLSASPTFASSSSTPSATPTTSPLLTQTPSRTSSATQTSSPAQTATPSPTVSATPSASPAQTATPSPTVSATPSLSPAQTATPSASPAQTATPSRTPSATPTNSPPATATPSATPTATQTASPTRTATATLSASATLTSGSTATSSATLTLTLTPSVSASASPSASPSATPTLTSTQVPGLSATASPSATFAIQDVPAKILRAAAWPQPGPRVLSVQLEGRAERLQLRVYSAGWRRLYEADFGAAGPGWVQLPLPPQLLAEAANGLYYYRLSADGQASAGVAGKLVLLR